MNNLDMLVETLHTLLCNKDHTGKVEELARNRREDVCYFYVEKNVSTGKEMPDHVFWHGQAVELIKSLNAQDANSALTSIYRVLDFVEKYNHLNQPEQQLALNLMGIEDEQ